MILIELFSIIQLSDTSYRLNLQRVEVEW